MRDREAGAAVALCIHHRCSRCGGSGVQNGQRVAVSRKDRVASMQPPSFFGSDCTLCKGNGLSHVTFSGFTNDVRNANWLMPDNRPLREVGIGNRRV